jgi:hypothetical protein
VNALIGNIVCARVRLAEPQDPTDFSTTLKQYCASRLLRSPVTLLDESPSAA